MMKTARSSDTLSNNLSLCEAFQRHKFDKLFLGDDTAGVSKISVEPAVFTNDRGLGQYGSFIHPYLKT